jgi:hypothetical protein
MRNNHPIGAGNDGKMSWTIPGLTAHSPVSPNHFFSVKIRTNIQTGYWDRIWGLDHLQHHGQHIGAKFGAKFSAE